MAQKIDLNKIKNEIDTRKNEKNMVSSQLGEKVGTGVAPRDTFLHGLLEARETGKDNASTNLIKVVENTVTATHGGVATHVVNEAPAPAVPATRKPIEMSPERDEQLFADLEKKKNATIAESISNFQGGAATSTPAPTINYNGQQMLTSIPANAPVSTGQINEAALVENVQTIVNSHLQQNLGPIFEEAIKGTIIEMYAIERIQDVLRENRDLIKDVVVETIKEIQARTKAKQKPQS